MPTLSLPRLQEFYTTRDASRPLSYSHRQEVEKVINLLKYLGVSNDEDVIKGLEGAQKSWFFPRYHATQALRKWVTDSPLSQEPDKNQSKWNRLVDHGKWNRLVDDGKWNRLVDDVSKKASTLTTEERSVTPSTDSSPHGETTNNDNTPPSTGEEYTFFIDPLSANGSPPRGDTNDCDNSKFVDKRPIPEDKYTMEDIEIAHSPSISDNQATSAVKPASSAAKATSESVDNEGKGLSFFSSSIGDILTMHELPPIPPTGRSKSTPEPAFILGCPVPESILKATNGLCGCFPGYSSVTPDDPDDDFSSVSTRTLPETSTYVSKHPEKIQVQTV